MKKLIYLRRASQLFFLVFFVYVLWSTTYPLRGIFSPQVLFKIDPLIMVITAVSERVLLPGLLFSLVMIGLTLILGRFFCGWMCPMGTTIDAVGFFRRKARKPLSEPLRIKISRPKFYILGAVVFLAVLGIQTAWVFDPIVVSARVVSLNIIPAITVSIDRAFQWLIQTFGLYSGVYDFYRSLKAGILGVNVHFFLSSLWTLVFFLLMTGAAVWVSRLWCRMLCPLGAFYAALANGALLERDVRGCTQCGICVHRCRTGAIREDVSYRKGECILCMDCLYDCKARATRFIWKRQSRTGAGRMNTDEEKKANRSAEKGVTRKDFLFCLGSLFSFFGLASVARASARGMQRVIRPPGAQKEDRFVDQCVRCGNCMKVCPTNGLQPVMMESGLEGIWTPQLVPEIGYCEYNCTLCGEVCPTSAIPRLPLARKQHVPLGTAVVERGICLAWGQKKECLVCEEHCPTPEKAIKKVEGEDVGGRMIFKPFVDKSLCIGCGICQNKCPVRPVRAIRVKANSF